MPSSWLSGLVHGEIVRRTLELTNGGSYVAAHQVCTARRRHALLWTLVRRRESGVRYVLAFHKPEGETSRYPVAEA